MKCVAYMDFNQVHRKREIIGKHCLGRQCYDNAVNTKGESSSAQRVFVQNAGAIHLNSVAFDVTKYKLQEICHFGSRLKETVLSISFLSE